MTGKAFVAELQRRAMRREPLEKVLLSQALRFVAGLLFVVPGFITDVFALVAFLASFMPGLFSKAINRHIQTWNTQFVVFNNQEGPQPWRDVTPEDPPIIDVSPEKPQSQDE